MRLSHSLKIGMVLAVLWGTAASAEVTLRAVTGLPGPTPVAQVFLQYVERVNAAGKGVVQIEHIGGPEAMPPGRQAAALQRGLIDMLHTPASFYAGSVREVDRCWAPTARSPRSAPTVRGTCSTNSGANS